LLLAAVAAMAKRISLAGSVVAAAAEDTDISHLQSVRAIQQLSLLE
jgi:hypothetical protein